MLKLGKIEERFIIGNKLEMCVLTGEPLGEDGLELDAARIAVDVALDVEDFPIVAVGDGGDGEDAEGRDESNSFCHFIFFSFIA